MVFEEPKAEFVEIEETNVVTASNGGPSVETCDGPQAMMNNCSAYNTMMNN